MTDIQARLVAALEALERETKHTDTCVRHDVELDMQGERPECICKLRERLRLASPENARGNPESERGA
jgi:hypothetical protein